MISKKNIYISGLVLLLLFSAIALFSNYVTKPFNDKADRIEKELYADDSDIQSVEVALIGGSHASNGFNPSALWRDYHIKAYNFSFSGVPVYLSYYYLKELYKKREFKVVVFDLYYAGSVNEVFGKDNYVFEIVSNMRWSAEKASFISSLVASENRSRYYFPLLYYHERFKELTKADFFREPMADNDYLLGGDYHFDRHAKEPVSFEDWNDTAECATLPEHSRIYLQKIIDLTREHGSNLLFVDLPHRYNDSYPPDTWVEDEYKNYNAVRKLAERNNIPMIQFDDKILHEIGFVPEEDMYNNGHMNIFGSEKIANYLGRYLCKNYDVTIFPEGSDALWDGYLEKYKTQLKGAAKVRPKSADL